MKIKLYTFAIVLLILTQQLKAQWSSPIPFPGADRDGAVSFMINGKGYVAGGIVTNEVWEYAPVTNSWAQKANMINVSANVFAASFVYNNIGYIVGGDSAFGNSMNKMWAYDATANSWTMKADFPGGNRVGLLSWVANNRVFIGGGADVFNSNGVGACHNDLYEYHPITDSWTLIGTLPISVAFASCFVLNDSCYFAYGSTSNTTYSNQLWKYNTITNAWNQKANCMGSTRNGSTGFAICGSGFAGLGQKNLSTQFTDIYQYNDATDTWAISNTYPTNNSFGTTAFVVDNVAYVGTGLNVSTFDFNSNFYKFSICSSNTGIDNNIHTQKNISLYPNPSKESVQITAYDQIENIIVTDITGKIIFSDHHIHLTNYSLNTTNFANGIYFIQLTSKQNIITQKLIIQH